MLLQFLNDTSSNSNKNTFLHLASQNEQPDVVLILLNSGSDPCIRNTQGKTPYCMTENANVRNIFKTFRMQNPEKFNYAKVCNKPYSSTSCNII